MRTVLSASVVGMKFSADVGVVERPAINIRWLHSGRGGEFSKKRSAAPSCFTTISLSEVKRAVLR